MQTDEHQIARLELREQRHRQRVLLAIAILILMATSPVLVHHVSEGIEPFIAGHDHLWAMCLIALHALLAPVHEIFHVLLLVGLGYASWDRTRAWLRLRRVLGTLAASAPRRGDRYWRAAVDAGVDPATVRVISGLPNPAFTAGWLRPRIYVARALAASVSQAELVAILAHEYSHVRHRDPARLSLLRFVGLALFWLPALRRLAEDMADEAEILADDVATRGRPLVLASAILRLASWQSARNGGDSLEWAERASAVTGFRRSSLLDRRIRRLAGEDAPVVSHVTRRSLTAAFAALALVWVSGLSVLHPMPPTDGSVEAHCRHRYEWAIEHLFCFADAIREPGAACPHDGKVTRS